MIRTILIFVLMVGVVSCSKNNGGQDTTPMVHDSDVRSSDAAPAQHSRLVREQPLPPLARDLLRLNMVEHGDSMEALLWSSLLLDHETTLVATERILDQPRLSRPSPELGDTLNDWLPDNFFQLQDRMYQSAEALNRAAKAKQDLEVARAFSRLIETCVSCHSLYLTLPVPELPAPGKQGMIRDRRVIDKEDS